MLSAGKLSDLIRCRSKQYVFILVIRLQNVVGGAIELGCCLSILLQSVASWLMANLQLIMQGCGMPEYALSIRLDKPILNLLLVQDQCKASHHLQQFQAKLSVSNLNDSLVFLCSITLLLSLHLLQPEELLTL